MGARAEERPLPLWLLVVRTAPGRGVSRKERGPGCGTPRTRHGASHGSHALKAKLQTCIMPHRRPCGDGRGTGGRLQAERGFQPTPGKGRAGVECGDGLRLRGRPAPPPALRQRRPDPVSSLSPPSPFPKRHRQHLPSGLSADAGRTARGGGDCSAGAAQPAPAGPELSLVPHDNGARSGGRHRPGRRGGQGEVWLLPGLSSAVWLRLGGKAHRSWRAALARVRPRAHLGTCAGRAREEALDWPAPVLAPRQERTGKAAAVEVARRVQNTGSGRGRARARTYLKEGRSACTGGGLGGPGPAVPFRMSLPVLAS